MPKYVEGSILSGSWPFSHPHSEFSPNLHQDSVDVRATLLGVSRETSSGYAVGDMSFYLWRDGVQHTVTFLPNAGVPYTLDGVVESINDSVGHLVASRDSGYLRVSSTTLGDGGSIKINVNADYEALTILGFFDGVEALAGDTSQARTSNDGLGPVAPGQLTAGEGESITRDVFNRVVAQLAANQDALHGRIDKQLIAVYAEESFTYVGAPGGVQLSGIAYTGPITSPDETQLEPYFKVLRMDGSEFTVDVLTPQYEGISTTFSIDTEHPQGLQKVTALIDLSVLANSNTYVIPSSGTFSGAKLKVLSSVDGDPKSVYVDTASWDETGTVTVDEGPIVIDISLSSLEVCKVSAVYKTDAETARVENISEERMTAVAISRIELNNRLYCEVSEVSDFSEVVPGDLVVIEGNSGGEIPYNNNGSYKVSKVINARTIELVTLEWGPVVLNPRGVDLGTITVSTDGEFRTTPWLSFLSNGAEPSDGDEFKIVYFGGSTMAGAMDTPDGFTNTPHVKRSLELGSKVKDALLAIAGPSFGTLDDIITPPVDSAGGGRDYRANVETTLAMYDMEHYAPGNPAETGFGRHQNIRPDIINMWGTIDGWTDPTVTIRALADHARVDTVFDFIGKTGRFKIFAEGHAEVDLSAVSYAGQIGYEGFTSHGSHAWDAQAGGGLIGYGGNDQVGDLDGYGIKGVGGGSYGEGVIGVSTDNGYAIRSYGPSLFEQFGTENGRAEVNIESSSDREHLVVTAGPASSSSSHGASVGLRRNLGGSHVTNNSVLGQVDFSGFNSSGGYDLSASVLARAKQEFSGDYSASLQFFTSESGSPIAHRWEIGATGNLTPAGDNDYDIGAATYRVKATYSKNIESSNIKAHTGNTVGMSDTIPFVSRSGYAGTPSAHFEYTGAEAAPSGEIVLASVRTDDHILSGDEIGRISFAGNTVGIGGDLSYTAFIRVVAYEDFDQTVDTKTDLEIWSGNVNGYSWTFQGKYGHLLPSSSGAQSIGWPEQRVGSIYASKVQLGMYDPTNLESGQGVYISSETGTGTVFQIKKELISHGMTTLADTEVLTLFTFSHPGDGLNNLKQRSFGEGHRAFDVNAYSSVGDTTTGIAGVGPVMFDAAKANGTGVTSFLDDFNIFVVKNNGSTQFIVKGDGDIRYNGVASAYDDEMDALACRDMAQVISNNHSDVVKYNSAQLERMGVMENGFISQQNFNGLVLGGIGEIFQVLALALSKIGMNYESLRVEMRGQE